ncbi:hydroxyacid dehydrogenase [bacterium]|nr:hydroxyacid dehydrogenase [bacterium]
MKRALYATNSFEAIYPPEVRAGIEELVSLVGPPQGAKVLEAAPELLPETQIILSGWGPPVLDEAFLKAAPNLEAVFYGAGSVRGMLTDAFWERDIVICSAWGANAVPVAEYTVSQILFCLKWGYRAMRSYRPEHRAERSKDVPGAYGSVVGLIGLGMIGRLVAEKLRPFDMQVIAYDPYARPEDAERLGLGLVSLDEIFKRSDVVSLHVPLLDGTRGMLGAEHFEAMKPNASFINSARGAIVRENEMVRVLQQRPDLFAVLDVTWPEPPSADSPLWEMENVVLTPHIAGSMGNEVGRHGRYMLDELRRYLVGEPLKWQVTRQVFETMA